MAKSTHKQPFLLIWDFDHTIVDDNTDTWYCSNLAPELKPLYERKGKPPFECWTDLMDDHMHQLHITGYSSSKILNCFHSIPMAPEIAEAIITANVKGATQYILSNSNTLFIKESLMGKGLSTFFPPEQVITNPAYVDKDTDRIHITRYQTPEKPHRCSTCEANLCKGVVLCKLREAHPDASIIYFGDGYNDLCPTSLLGHNDIVFAREGETFSLGALWRARLLDNLSESLSVSPRVSPRVYFWTTGAQLLEQLCPLLIS